MAKKKRGSMKGFSQKSGDKRPTKSGAGMTKKGVAKYRRQNPGSKLKTAVTGKVKPLMETMLRFSRVQHSPCR